VASRPGVEVLDWEGTQPELAGTIALDASTNYILQLLLGLLVAAGVLNTMLMSVLERQREFGVMLALGVTPGQLTGLVLVESVLVGLVGAALGGLVSVPWYVWMRRVGIDLSESFGEMDAGGVLMDPVLHLDLTVSASLAILAGVIALTALAGIYPAVRAGRQVPVESLKAL
jgi:ABC-type lipoprotein release transport system permease subunit